MKYLMRMIAYLRRTLSQYNLINRYQNPNNNQFNQLLNPYHHRILLSNNSRSKERLFNNLRKIYRQGINYNKNSHFRQVLEFNPKFWSLYRQGCYKIKQVKNPFPPLDHNNSDLQQRQLRRRWFKNQHKLFNHSKNNNNLLQEQELSQKLSSKVFSN